MAKVHVLSMGEVKGKVSTKNLLFFDIFSYITCCYFLVFLLSVEIVSYFVRIQSTSFFTKYIFAKQKPLKPCNKGYVLGTSPSTQIFSEHSSLLLSMLIMETFCCWHSLTVSAIYPSKWTTLMVRIGRCNTRSCPFFDKFMLYVCFLVLFNKKRQLKSLKSQFQIPLPWPYILNSSTLLITFSLFGLNYYG